MSKKTKRDRGYTIRKRQGWASRHPRHSVRVHACPLCMPHMPDVKHAEEVTVGGEA